MRTEKCLGWAGSSWPSSSMPAMWVALAVDHQGIEAMVAMKEMNPESRIIEMESPSAPTKYSTLKGRIQMALATSCTPALLGSYMTQAAMAAAKESRLVTSAIQRLASSMGFLARPAKARAIMSRTIRPAPMSGKKVAQLRTLPSVKNMSEAPLSRQGSRKLMRTTTSAPPSAP